MDLTRRSLFRSIGALGGLAAVGGATGLAAEAVAGVVPKTHTTTQFTIKKGKANVKGWRPLVKGPAEPHQVRTDLATPAQKGRAKRRTPMLVFAQLSDVHIVDTQSPARLESGESVSSSAYRPQEILTAHIAESMVRQLNRTKGPITGQKPELAVQTGDNSDNGQFNEVRWNIDILSGGTITPDSGDLTRYEGVMDNTEGYYDPSFWHPHGTPKGEKKDVYQKFYGFPTMPGLLNRCREPFEAHGLDFPWLSVFGNHDQLVQGNFAHNAGYNNKAVGGSKQVNVSPDGSGQRPVTADPDRRLVSKQEFVEEHFHSNGLPVGHGFTEDNRTDGTGYYTYDQGNVRFIVLDSVHDSSDRGSIDATQFAWLQGELDAATDKAVIVCSHHTSWTMTATAPHVGDYVRGDALVAELLARPNVIAWVNGHTHRNEVRPHVGDTGGFWEINTASHIDFPQQARLIEVLDNHDGTLSLFCTMVDHRAPTEIVKRPTTPTELGALGRLLAANDPQEREDKRGGEKVDRNVELLVAAPAFLTV